MSRWSRSLALIAARQQAGAFSPLSISGCVLWLKADGNVYNTGTTQATDGQDVATWVDASGNGNDATGYGAIKPTFETNEINTLPVVATNGTHAYLKGSVSITGTALTAFVVTSTGSTGSAYARLLELANAGGGGYGATDACSAILLFDYAKITTGRNNNNPGTISTTDGVHFVATASYDGTNATIRKNGTGALSVSSSGSFAITQYALASTAAGGDLAGPTEFAEILVYDSALGTTDRKAVEHYLLAKYDLSAPAITSIVADTLRNNYAGWVGFRFNVGADDLTVTELGRWKVSGNSGSRALEIRNSSGTVVASATLDMSLGSAGGFTFVKLGSPVVLSASGTYYMISSEANGGDEWHDDVSGMNVTPTTAITVTGSVYSSGSGVPTLATPDVHSYGRPNFKYYV